MGENHGDDAGVEGDVEWIPLTEAARRLNVSPSAIYGRVRRKTVISKPKGNRGLLVQWPIDGHEPHGDDTGDVPNDETNDAELVAELRVDLARVETELTAERRFNGDLKNQLAEAQASYERWRGEDRERIKQLEEELRGERRPWWRRMLG